MTELLMYFDVKKLEKVIKDKRPEVANCKSIMCHHYNARSHTSLAIRQKLLELAWKLDVTRWPFIAIITGLFER